MDIITNEYFICISGLLVGIAINIISKLAELEAHEKFDFSIWMKLNLWRTFSSVASTLVGVLYMLDSGSHIGFFEALSIGFVGDAIIKRGRKQGKPIQNAGWTELGRKTD